MSSPVMSTIVRTWVAFAALGTGILHLALAIGAPLPVAFVFGAFGFVEFAWGVVTFAREPLAPRVAIGVALAPILVWALLLTVSAGGGPPELAASVNLLPIAVSTLFELFVVAVLGVHLRRSGAAVAAPGTARYLVGVAAGALAVAALTAPALAVTEAGLGAVPHGGIIDDEHDPH